MTERTSLPAEIVRDHLRQRATTMVDDIAKVAPVERIDVIGGLMGGLIDASIADHGTKRTTAWLRALARRIDRAASRPHPQAKV